MNLNFIITSVISHISKKMIRQFVDLIRYLVNSYGTFQFWLRMKRILDSSGRNTLVLYEQSEGYCPKQK